MNALLRIRKSDHHAIEKYLLQNALEQAAFVFASVGEEQDSVIFDAQTYRLVPPGGYAFQTPYGFELTDEEWATAIKMAWDSQAALIEMHSHPWAKLAQFSPSDLEGLKEVVPHVRWRLRGKPYLAIVVGRRNHDALAWLAEDSQTPMPVQGILVGDRLHPPTGETLQLLTPAPNR